MASLLLISNASSPTHYLLRTFQLIIRLLFPTPVLLLPFNMIMILSPISTQQSTKLHTNGNQMLSVMLSINVTFFDENTKFLTCLSLTPYHSWIGLSKLHPSTQSKLLPNACYGTNVLDIPAIIIFTLLINLLTASHNSNTLIPSSSDAPPASVLSSPSPLVPAPP